MIPRRLRDLCLLALMPLFAGTSFAQSNHAINFVFLNGIKNTYADALITSSTIRPISRRVVDRVNSVCPAFDPATGGTPLRRQPPAVLWNPTGGFTIDTLEVRQSKVLEEALVGETAMSPPDPLDLGQLRALAVQSSQTLSQEDSAVLDVISEGSTWIKSTLAKGEAVILIAHSQGALIANRILLALLRTLSEPEWRRLALVTLGGANALKLTPFEFRSAGDRVTGPQGLLPPLGRTTDRRTRICPSGFCPFATGSYTHPSPILSSDRLNHSADPTYVGGAFYELSPSTIRSGREIFEELLFHAAMWAVKDYCYPPLAQVWRKFVPLVESRPCADPARRASTRVSEQNVVEQTDCNGVQVFQGGGPTAWYFLEYSSDFVLGGAYAWYFVARALRDSQARERWDGTPVGQPLDAVGAGIGGLGAQPETVGALGQFRTTMERIVLLLQALNGKNCVMQGANAVLALEETNVGTRVLTVAFVNNVQPLGRIELFVDLWRNYSYKESYAEDSLRLTMFDGVQPLLRISVDRQGAWSVSFVESNKACAGAGFNLLDGPAWRN